VLRTGKKIKLNLDMPLLISALALIIIGILSVYSANIMKPAYSGKYVKQIIFFFSGLVMFFMFLYFEYHKMSEMWLILYGLSVFLLLITILFAKKIHGARSWIFIFGQGFQPSEIVKLLTIVWLAKYLDNVKKNIRQLKYFMITLLLCAPVLGLVLLQNDFGTATIYFPIILTMIFISGARKTHILSVILIAVIGLFIPLVSFYVGEILQIQSGLLIALSKSSVSILLSLIFITLSGILYFVHKRFREKFIYIISVLFLCFSLGFVASTAAKTFLKKHHYLRFLAFIDKKNVDPRGAGWNISQALTAVGAGGFRGQGFLKGNQKNGGFLPAQDTDFIFPVIAEEWGFFGSIVIIILFIIVMYRGINVIFNAKDMVGSLIATGITGMLFFHILINLGMSVGIMPVMGLPLPFLSYGGSFLVTCMAGVGLLLNVEMRRYVY
jgi:rod shape determining protein RodA